MPYWKPTLEGPSLQDYPPLSSSLESPSDLRFSHPQMSFHLSTRCSHLGLNLRIGGALFAYYLDPPFLAFPHFAYSFVVVVVAASMSRGAFEECYNSGLFEITWSSIFDFQHSSFRARLEAQQAHF